MLFRSHEFSEELLEKVSFIHIDSMFSRMMTVKMKCPITIFLISGIIPLVPGAGIYYTAYYLVTNQYMKAAEKGIESVKIAFAIVLGIIFIVSIPRELFRLKYWKQRRFKKG